MPLRRDPSVTCSWPAVYNWASPLWAVLWAQRAVFWAGRATARRRNLARLSAVHTERTVPLIIVGAAIVADGRVLACERAEPSDVAGKWEFPGGKVEAGENELDALVRECEEELGIKIAVGDRIGVDVPMARGWAMLRVWLATIVSGEPRPLEHASLRWLATDELDSVPWLPADAPIVTALAQVLPTL